MKGEMFHCGHSGSYGRVKDRYESVFHTAVATSVSSRAEKDPFPIEVKPSVK